MEKKSNFILDKVIRHLGLPSKIKNNELLRAGVEEQMVIGFISSILISSKNLLRKIRRLTTNTNKQVRFLSG